jgi:hypothetical protein
VDSKTKKGKGEDYAMNPIPLFSLTTLILAAVTAQAAEPLQNIIVGLDTKRQAITAVHRESGKIFQFTVKDAALFKSAKLCETFEAPVAEMQKGNDFAADFGNADPKKSCCTLTTDIGGAGRALGVRRYEQEGVDVILAEMKRTSGDTVTARWQYCNGGKQMVRFKEQGCVGMGCTYTLAEEVHFLDGATRTKHDVLRDTSNKALAERYTSDKLAVAPNRLLATWAKFQAPPESTTNVTVVIPGVSEPFEDVPIANGN